MLILGRADVERLLDLDALIDALARVMADLSASRASVPNRVAATVEEHDGLLAAMPAHAPAAGSLMAKLVTVYPRNAGSDLPTHQAVVVCFDPGTGRPVALLDGSAVTAARTAAGSALATRLLARPDARILALVGTGVQARAHARAVTRVRGFERVLVAGRDRSKAEALADELGPELEAEIRAVDTWEQACSQADVVCAATHSVEPVVRRRWLRPGTHVNSVGFNPQGREVDDATVVDALVVVESRAAALAPFPSGANDLLEPIAAGLMTPDHVHAEIGEIVMGQAPGRTTPEQLTLYRSVGVAVQDAAAAALVLEAAADAGAGTEIDL